MQKDIVGILGELVKMAGQAATKPFETAGTLSAQTPKMVMDALLPQPQNIMSNEAVGKLANLGTKQEQQPTQINLNDLMTGKTQGQQKQGVVDNAMFNPNKELFDNALKTAKKVQSRQIEEAVASGVPVESVVDTAMQSTGMNKQNDMLAQGFNILKGILPMLNMPELMQNKLDKQKADVELTHGQAGYYTPEGREALSRAEAKGKFPFEMAQAEAKAISDARTAMMTKIPEYELKYGNEFRDDTKQLVKVMNSFDTVAKAYELAKSGNPAADLQLIYSVIKMWDPDSAVKEGEITLTKSVPPAIQKLAGIYRNVFKGGTALDAKTRKQMFQTAQGAYNTASKEYEHVANEYDRVMSEQGLSAKRALRLRGGSNKSQSSNIKSITLIEE